MAALSPARKEELHRRGLLLEWFTVAWNVIEGVVAIGAGLVTGSVSLVAFGADSFIEVISAVALLWRLRKAGPHASAEERGDAERKALYLVAATFFLLAWPTTAVAAAIFCSAISVACFATWLKLEYAEFAAAIADFTAATATSEPAGAFFASLSRMPATFLLNSPACPSRTRVNSA